jgi:adenylate cyclase
VYLTAAIAVGLQVALNRIGEADAVVTIMTVTAIACVALLAANAGRRTVALVASVAGEQLRRERLGRYFSPHVAERLEGQGEALGTGESREVTLLFSDIRGFTQLSETLSGEHVVGMLNEYLERMVERIFAHGGTLDKYMGDGIMAYFGAPVAQADHAERAVRCALSMQDALTDLNHLRARRGEPPLRMGIGIHTGQVVVGDIGAARRREYTAIGDAVNVAARMEELTKVHGAPILVSEETRRRVGDRVVFRSAAPTRVRGKSVPLASFVPEPSEP